MKDSDLTHILIGIDTALEVYRKNEGRLSAREISLKSMLNAVREQVMDELRNRSAETHPSLSLDRLEKRV
jgi:hypothetical protein